MKEQLQQRLDQLRSELEAGQKMKADLEAQVASLKETMLRISGAIQVLEEELNAAAEAENPIDLPEDGAVVNTGAQ